MKFIRVTMPDGSKYDIPADYVASDRASYYADRDTKDLEVIPAGLWHTIYDKEYKYTLEDDYELTDWLSNNVNWEDVKKMAKKVNERPKLTKEDLQEGIVNGDKEIIEK